MKLFEDLLDTTHELATINSDREFKYVNGNTMKVNTNNILDQYFTKQDIANKLFEKSCAIISQ